MLNKRKRTKKFERTIDNDFSLISSSKHCGLGWSMSNLRSSQKPLISLEYDSEHSSYNLPRKTSAVAYMKMGIYQGKIKENTNESKTSNS